jgi:hypothetical protein
MNTKETFHKPWLVAVWPGMGHVAMAAGYYLMAKLGMHLFAEFAARELFDVDHVSVKKGRISAGALPRSRFFVWRDPQQRHDIILFVGEAQPTTGKYVFCQRLVEFARELHVERVFTFAAMATQMHPEHESRVFGAATSQAGVDELKQRKLVMLDEGHISGLNGVLLGVAAEHEMWGTCLLGEMPHIFAQLPFPKASLAVLRTFAVMAGVDIDFTELTEQAEAMQEKLGEILAQVEEVMEREPPRVDDEGFSIEPAEEPQLSREDEHRIERLFAEAARDRSKAYELKRELDQLDVFKQYEDRFLDLFKHRE